jgi:hypothetical protein
MRPGRNGCDDLMVKITAERLVIYPSAGRIRVSSLEAEWNLWPTLVLVVAMAALGCWVVTVIVTRPMRPPRFREPGG